MKLQGALLLDPAVLVAFSIFPSTSVFARSSHLAENRCLGSLFFYSEQIRRDSLSPHPYVIIC